MRYIFFGFILGCALFADVSITSADFWSNNNPLKSVTPHWGPLVPHPQTGPEMAPPCWGAPQGCRNPPGDTRPSTSGPPVSAYAYVVIYRYFCRYTPENTDAGSCDVTTTAASCQAAASAQPYYTYSRDPCKSCTPSIFDGSKQWVNTESIQGGPCIGW